MSSLNHIGSTSELNKFMTECDKTKSYFLSSPDSEICRTVDCIAGIDEAGRGPVLGPMVYGICYCIKEKECNLKEIGSADSKSLTEDKREGIFNKMCSEEYLGWEVKVISPNEISNCMLRRQKHSLNEVSHNAAIDLIRRALDAGIRITEVFVDTVGPPEKYQAKLQAIFPELSVTVSKKADSIYSVVGAASICAKVTRDVCLRTWTFPEIPEKKKLKWGSGYPGDPETKNFLETNIDPTFGFPQLVRFSWSTAEKILEENATTVEWEEVEQPSRKVRSVKSFFTKSTENPLKVKHKFFKDRHLTSVVDFS